MNARFDGVPDIREAKRIPITDVADRLGIERCGAMWRCWRPNNHKHADHTPSVSVWRRKNRVRCFNCDGRTLSTVDVVQSVRRLDVFAALLWLDENFGPLPRIEKKRRNQDSSSHWYGPAGKGGRLEAVILSGLLAELSNNEARLLFVLDSFCDVEANRCTMSYRALQRYSGIRGDRHLAAAIRGLRRIHLLEVERGSGGRGRSQCSGYSLTVEHVDFLALVRATHAQTTSEIEIERLSRAQRRKRLSEAQKTKSEGYTGKYCLPSEGSSSLIPTSLEGSRSEVSPLDV